METKADLATGHARTALAKTRMRNGWMEIARALNSDGNGCVKDWKQWAKYWKDKKAAVKRKANMIMAARQRTGGGVEDIAELTDLEQRIVSIAGGLSFATGDRHLAIPFLGQENLITITPTTSEPISNESESILLQNETAATVGEGSSCGLELPLAIPTNSTDEVPGVHIITQNEDETPSLDENNEVLQRNEMDHPTPPTTGACDGGNQGSILVATPSRRRCLFQSPNRPSGFSPRQHHNILRSPHRSGVSRGRVSATRRRLRRSPPSQRRSEMASLTERFIAIEERRVDAENTIARSLETFAQGHHIMAGALDRFTHAIGQASQQIIEAIQHRIPHVSSDNI